MATIKYKDENGNLVSLGAGLHTHSPSSIGAADREHGHDAATADNDGFLSSTDKTKIDNLNDTVFGTDDKLGLVDLIDETPINEKLSELSENIDKQLLEKVDKDGNKVLSTNDYTDADKEKLAGLENYELPVAAKGTLGGVKTTSTITTITNYTACPIVDGVPYYQNTKNTAGATNTSSKIYLVGATSQVSYPATYSHDTAYVDTDGCLYSDGKKVSVEGHTHTVDDALSETSTNPVQNKVVYAIDAKIGPDPVSEQISDHADALASTSAAGHMSATDKTKLDGIATGANKYSLPTASSSNLGGVKIGTGLSISSGKVSVSNPLPTVTTSNNGQFLRVVSGAWAAVTIKTAESEAL